MALRRGGQKLLELQIDFRSSSLLLSVTHGAKDRFAHDPNCFSWICTPPGSHGLSSLSSTDADSARTHSHRAAPQLPPLLAQYPPLLQLQQQRTALVTRLFFSSPFSSEKSSQKSKDAEACDSAVSDYNKLRGRLDALQKPSTMRPWYLYVGDLIKGVASLSLTVGKFVIKVPVYINDYRTMSKEDWTKKKAAMWKTVKNEAHHYKVGTQLLRERKQLTRTTADMLRLVPMVVILAIPFLEFFLPVLLKIFPNMLPSTYEDKLQKEEQLKRRLTVRLELARFLQDTVAEMAADISRRGGGEKSVTGQELYAFVKKFTGISPFGTDAYLRTRLRSHLSQIKKDDYDIENEGLENLTEEELRAACRTRGMQSPFGEGAKAFMRSKMQDWLDLSLHRGLPSSLLLLSRAFTITATPTMDIAKKKDMQYSKLKETIGFIPLDLDIAKKKDMQYSKLKETIIFIPLDLDIAKKKDMQYSKLKETIGVIPEDLVSSLSYEAGGDNSDGVEALQKKLEILKREEWLIKQELARTAGTSKTMKSEAAAKLAEVASSIKMLGVPGADEVEEAKRKKVVEEEEEEEHERLSSSSSEEERAEEMAEQRERRIKATIEALEELTSSNAVTHERYPLPPLLFALVELSSDSGVTKERHAFLQLMNREIERVNNDLAKKSAPGLLVFTGKGLSHKLEDGEVILSDPNDKAKAKVSKKAASIADIQKKLGDRVNKMLSSIELDLDRKKLGDRVNKMLSSIELDLDRVSDKGLDFDRVRDIGLDLDRKKLGDKVNKMLSSIEFGLDRKKLGERVNKMLSIMESDLDRADSTIGSTMRMLDKDDDGLVSQQELEEAIAFIRDRLSQEELNLLLDRLSGTETGVTVEHILGLTKKSADKGQEVTKIHMK
eukprot:gene23294-30530_t